MPLGDTFSLVVHQVRNPTNLGAIARLMANFGLGRLVLSEMRIGDFWEAEKLAVLSEQVLQQARMCASLEEALGDVVYALGTTSREVHGRSSLTPEEGVARLAKASARGRVALVLGGEKRGLSDQDLSRCQDIVVIPTSAEQPSMNLSQAAAVLLYLVSRAERPQLPVPAEPGATMETVQALERQMDEVLIAAGFLHRQAPEPMRDELVRTLLRGELTQSEARHWLTAFKKLGHAIAKAQKS